MVQRTSVGSAPRGQPPHPGAANGHRGRGSAALRHGRRRGRQDPGPHPARGPPGAGRTPSRPTGRWSRPSAARRPRSCGPACGRSGSRASGRHLPPHRARAAAASTGRCAGRPRAATAARPAPARWPRWPQADPRRVRALDGEIGWAKARLVTPDATRRRPAGPSGAAALPADQVAEVYARYEAERSRRHLLDFDDLIVACADALAGDASFADAVRWRTRHLFVDEMQDVNPAQFRLLTALLVRRARPLRRGRSQPVGVRVQRRRSDPARPPA